MAEPGYDYTGLLLIGDPHLEGRQPGFRKDDYPNVILEKLEWCLNYAKAHRLLPIILGDLFDKPRDNPTWMLNRLLEMMRPIECIGIYGNHDCADPQLSDHDSLSLLVSAGCLRLVDQESVWRGVMNGRAVVVGGSSYRQAIPKSFDAVSCDNHTANMAGDVNAIPPLVVWLAHHDILVPGYEEQGRVKPREIPGIDLVANGHIHRQLQTVAVGATTWLTPGNISRRSRNDAVRDHVPAVLRLDVPPTGEHILSRVEVPHEPFDDVFHEAIADVAEESAGSAFVAGLAELQARRTESGAGLMSFLQENADQFSNDVMTEIMDLAKEATGYGPTEAHGQ